MNKTRPFAYSLESKRRSRRVVVSSQTEIGARLGLGALPDEVIHGLVLSPFDFVQHYLSRVKLKEKAAWYQGLALLLQRGASLRTAFLAANRRVTSLRFRGAVGDLAAAVLNRGEKFSQAMEGRPDVFSETERTLVFAGEQSGELSTVLKEIGQSLEREQSLQGKVVGALAYPFLILLLGLGVLFGVVFFLLPEFQKTYNALGVELPVYTRILLSGSEFLHSFPLLVLGGSFLSAFLLTSLWRPLRRSRGFHALQLRAPVLGELFHCLYLGRALRTLTLLLGSGVSHRQSYEILEKAVSNRVYQDYFRSVGGRITRGEGFAVSFLSERHRLGTWGDDLASLLLVGQMSGSPLEVLGPLVRELEEKVKVLTELLPKPLGLITLLFVAAIIGLIMAAVFIPNLNLALELLQK
jgi:type IV pilus assembly protein PilC